MHRNTGIKRVHVCSRGQNFGNSRNVDFSINIIKSASARDYNENETETLSRKSRGGEPKQRVPWTRSLQIAEIMETRCHSDTDMVSLTKWKGEPKVTVGPTLEISMPEYIRQWIFGARRWSRSLLVTSYMHRRLATVLTRELRFYRTTANCVSCKKQKIDQ